MTPEKAFHKAMEFHKTGQLIKAIRIYDELLRHFPNHGDTLNLRGEIELQEGRVESALTFFDRAVAAAPQYSSAHANRGSALHRLGRDESALESYGLALALTPEAFHVRLARASLLLTQNRFSEVVYECSSILALCPPSGPVLAMRGRALRAMGRRVDALSDLESALALDPHINLLAGEALHLSLQLGAWRDFGIKVEKIRHAIESGRLIVEPLTAVALPLTAAEQHKAASTFSQTFVEDKLQQKALQVGRRANEKLRIGYFSADFFDHVTSHLMLEMLEAHDTSQFEVLAFSYGGKRDAFRERIIHAVSEFIDVESLDSSQIAELARRKNVHIAVDINGYSGGCRPHVFALRTAPIQVNYLGFPGTMGTDYHDYIIGDRFVTPREAAGEFRESIVTMPHSYQPNSAIKLSAVSRPVTRVEVGLPERSFVFCCFNAAFKTTPDAFSVWMRLLLAIDGSVLWLLEEDETCTANIRREARERGVSPERIVFAPRVPIGIHLARYAHADVFLDTFYYNAHTTGGDALLMGVPMVTCRGKSFASRVGASLLNAVGLPEMVAETPETYEALALQLARDPVLLAKMRTRLRQHISATPLFDPKTYARNLESAYRSMWERYEAGLPPDHITVA